MNKRTIFASAVALLTTAGIAFAADQVNQPQQGDMPPPPAHGKKNSKRPEHNKDGLPRGFNKLNLTAAQKTKIKAIMEEGRPAKPTSQEEQRHAVFQVLTPTQQKQFLENQKQQRERFEKNHLKPKQAK